MNLRKACGLIALLTFNNDLTLASLNSLAVNETFDPLTWGTLNAGSFSAIELPGGYTWDTTQLAVDGKIRGPASGSCISQRT